MKPIDSHGRGPSLGRALVIWVALLGLAIANGALRVALLIPRLGEPRAHVVSTLLLTLGIALLVYATIGWISPATAGRALAIGALWVGLTVAFEFGFGHFVAQRSWAELCADYDLARGRIWPLVLLTTGLAPWCCGRLRQRLAP